MAKAKYDMPIFIVSGDHDMEQLVDHGPDCQVTTYKPNLQKGQKRYFGPEEVREKYGVDADQLSQLFALVGDKSDNIEGIKGVGPKTAAKWLNKYGDLSEVLAHEPKVTDEDREKVSTNFFLMDLAQPGIEYNPTISGLRIPPLKGRELEINEFLDRWELHSFSCDDLEGDF